MSNLNRVLLMGNLTRDVEMRYTPSGMANAKLGLAINRVYNDKKTNEKKQEVTFVDVEVWSKTAEHCNTYLKKGSPVFVEGRLKFETWDDKATGQKRSKLLVVAESVQFLASKSDKAKADQAKSNAAYSNPPAEASEPNDGPTDENIPF